MSDKEKEAQAWLAFASAAVAGYKPPEDEDFESFEDEIDDMIDVASAVADGMTLEFMARFGGKTRAAAPRTRNAAGRRRRKTDEDE